VRLQLRVGVVKGRFYRVLRWIWRLERGPVRFQLLGGLAVWDDGGEPVAVVGPTRRGLLAILLLHAGEVLPADRLIDELWGERAPATAAKSLQVHVWRLRKALGSDGGEGC
jgi:DNA-binding SARP family transcriptional activator